MTLQEITFDIKTGIWPSSKIVTEEFIRIHDVWYYRHPKQIPADHYLQEKLDKAFQGTLAEAEKAKARYHG
jgi:hypothetical protein